jgi:excisionase family DNA binding protein
MPTDVMFRFDEAVRTLGVTPERLDKLIAEGKIRAEYQGPMVLIPRKAILDYLASVTAVPLKERNK